MADCCCSRLAVSRGPSLRRQLTRHGTSPSDWRTRLTRHGGQALQWLQPITAPSGIRAAAAEWGEVSLSAETSASVSVWAWMSALP
jgi:hypothetical protein